MQSCRSSDIVHSGPTQKFLNTLLGQVSEQPCFLHQTNGSLENCSAQSASASYGRVCCAASVMHVIRMATTVSILLIASTSTAAVTTGTGCISNFAVRHCWYASACDPTYYIVGGCWTVMSSYACQCVLWCKLKPEVIMWHITQQSAHHASLIRRSRTTYVLQTH